ncbi:uncharacterized protein LOC106409704 [Brassica napus]|uniref:uncharacterized protein LOC106409704 n=1 Tax=Brassica napus TaxID=3708 RepID=UPI0006AAB92A|nr:uncharacterized protein LOC106409704 [Brassica napus]
MNTTRVHGTTVVPPPMPPGATVLALNHADSSYRSNSYPQMTLNAMLNSPARLSQLYLHPNKLNGALWFGIGPSVNAFIRATWQGYYMWPWKSWRKVPDERRESWWQTFVVRREGRDSQGVPPRTPLQNFYWDSEFNDLVYALWKKEIWTTIDTPVGALSDRSSQKEEQEGCKIPQMIESGTNERPSYTDLVRKTHTRKDGTFVDYHAEELVTQAEIEAIQLSNTERSPGSRIASSAPSRLMLNKAYLKLVLVFTVLPFLSENAKGKRGHVYGLGSAQYREHVPSSRVPNGLAHKLKLKMRVGSLEKSLKSVNRLLQTLLLQQAPTGQTSAQPQAPTTQPNPVNGK